MHVLALLQPLDPVSGNRVTVSIASAQLRSITGLGGQRWWGAMLRKPQLTLKLFDGDFTSSVEPGTAAFSLALDQIERMDANVRRYVWQGAPVALYAGDETTAWPWPTEFVGKVQDFAAQGHRLDLKADVDTSPFDATVPNATYAGTGGIEGGTDLKGTVKPWVLGAARFVEPVLINSVDSVFQVSSYAAIKDVTTLYERGAQFGPPVGNYANYAALVAASIPNGRWAQCRASGLIRLGAPPAGVITVDVEGDYAASTLARKPGAVIKRIAALAGISTSLLDTASLDALDADVGALPLGGFINLVLREETKVIEIARRIARSCNWQAGVGFDGKLFVTKPGVGSPSVTIDAQGRRLPGVLSTSGTTVSPPYRKIQMSGARCWRPLSLDEIAFAAPLTPRGLYDDAVTYREGDIVQLIDGSQWLFVGETPAAGSYPAGSNPNWSRMSGATGVPLYLNYFPTAGDSSEGQLLFRYDMDNRVFRRAADGETPVWVEITDPRILQSLDLAGAAAGAAENAQEAADEAKTAAHAALADLTLIASDNKLTPNEKPRVIRDRDVIVAEQAGIDAQASALGITTQKTAYDNAITTLVNYLATLTTPALWSNLSGVTDIVGTTFRTRFTTVYTARQTLLDKIADVLKARADAAQTDATTALTEIGRIASDGWLSRGEKPQVQRDYDALYENWQALDDKASALGIASAQRTVANAAMSALYSYLSGLSPSWTDVSQNTAIVAATFSARWADAYSTVAALQAAIQGQPGPALFTLVADGAVTVGSDQIVKTGGNAWDAGAHSAEAFVGGAMASATIDGVANNMVFGLNTDPTTDADYTSIDYGWRKISANQLHTIINGVSTNVGTWSGGDVLTVVYDNARVCWYQNGVLLRTVSAPSGLRLYFDSSIHTTGGVLRGIKFSAVGSAGVNGAGVPTLKLDDADSDGDSYTIQGDKITKTGANGSTDSVYSQEAYGSFYLRVIAPSVSSRVGVNTSVPTHTPSCSFRLQSESIGLDFIVHNGSNVWSGTVPVDAVLEMVGDGKAIQYYINGVLTYTGAVPSPGPWQLCAWISSNGFSMEGLRFGPTGAAGADGLSVAELTIYRAASTQPAVPAGGSYNFATKVLTPPSGWSTVWPTGTAKKWAASGYAAIEGLTGTATPTWLGVGGGIADGSDGAPGSPGADGSPGLSTNVIFRRGTSQPATPSPSSGVPSGFYDDAGDVPSGAGYVYAFFGTRATPASNWIWQAGKKVEGTDALVVVPSPSAITLQTYASGALKPGQTPKGISNTAYRAGSTVAISSISLVTQSNCTASVSGSTVTVANPTSDGYVVYDVTAGGVTQRVRVDITLGSDGADGAVAQNLAITSTITGTSYAQLGGTIALNASASGKLDVNFTGNYRSPQANLASFQAQTKMQYRVAGGTWVDVSGSEKIGNLSEASSEPPYLPNNASVNGTGPYHLTGLTANGAYEVRVLARKYAGASANSGTVSTRIYAEQIT